MSPGSQGLVLLDLSTPRATNKNVAGVSVTIVILEIPFKEKILNIFCLLKLMASQVLAPQDQDQFVKETRLILHHLVHGA